MAYLLTCLIAGILLARVATIDGLMIAIIGFVGALFSVLLSRKRGVFTSLWGPVFLLSGTAVFYNYGLLRLPAAPGSTTLSQAPREALIQMQVIRIFNQASQEENRVSGLARVLEGPPYCEIKPGARLYFSLQTKPEDRLRLYEGAQIETAGVLRVIPKPNQSGFNQYLWNNGVYYRFSQNRALNITKQASAFRIFCVRQNQRFQEILNSGRDGAENQARVYTAMLLGARSGLTQVQQSRYQASGAMHLFAISGLHIGVIAMALATSLRLFRIPYRLVPFIGLPLLYLYVQITGGTPSAMRAFIMALFFWTAYAFQRQRNPFAALVASAFVVLLFDPFQLWSLGFQLSYTVVASILLFGLPLQSLITRWAQPFRWLPESDWTQWQRILQRCIDGILLLFAISFSAWLASIPLSLGHFGYFSLPAVLINMLLVNMAAFVICTGCLSLASGLIFGTGLAAFLNHAAWLSIALMDCLSYWVESIPGVMLSITNFPLPFTYSALFAYFAYLVYLNRKPSNACSAWLFIAPILLALFLISPLLWV